MAATAIGLPSARNAHDRIMREVAATYRRRGYKVSVAPEPTELPAFLSDLHPDILATGPDESVIVEIKLPKKTDPQRWRHLAEKIAQNPGWRFDIVVPDVDDLDYLPNLTKDEIEERLLQARQMMDVGSLDVALMAAWSAAEVVLRVMKKEQGVDAPDSRPGTLIARLYSDGDLERKDYDRLSEILQLRNAVTHGYKRKITSKDITYLSSFTERALR